MEAAVGEGSPATSLADGGQFAIYDAHLRAEQPIKKKKKKKKHRRHHHGKKQEAPLLAPWNAERSGADGGTAVDVTPTSTKASKSKRVLTKSQRAELVMPVSRIHRNMKNGKYASKISEGAPIFLTGALEYLVAELLEISGNHARDSKRKRISPRHILLAIQNDEELKKLMDAVIIPGGGRVPHVHRALVKSEKQQEHYRAKN